MSTWLDKLPLDVQVKILENLSSKTLVRLMCTCTSLFNLVSNPALTISRSIHGSRDHVYCNVSFNGQQRFFLFRDNVDDSFDFVEEVSCFTIDISCFLVGSVYGLVCFANAFQTIHSDVILWNPFIGKSLTVHIPIAGNEKSYAIGFGFDHYCLDYKVVRIGINDNVVWADVYTLRADEWENVVRSISRPGLRILGDGVFVNNTLHWILKFPISSGDRRYSILTYNLSKREFGEINVQESMGHNIMSVTKLSINGEDKLVLYRGTQNLDFYVWVMEKYGVVESWNEICILDSKRHENFLKKLHTDEFIKVLHTRKNGDFVLSTTRGRLFSCKINSDDGKTNIVIIPNNGMQLDYVGPYFRTPVFVKQRCTRLLRDTEICTGTWTSKRKSEDDDYDRQEVEINQY